MHRSLLATTAAAAAVIAPLAVSARGTLGFDLGVRLSDASCKTTADFETDFKFLRNQTGSTIFRTYSILDQPIPTVPLCNVPEVILPAAHNTGVQVVLGLWADDAADGSGDKGFENELDALLVVLKHTDYYNSIAAFTVGSEGLYRAQQHASDSTLNPDPGYTDTWLLPKINEVKQKTGGRKKVGTADSWNKYADGSADALISGGVDLLLVNAFGYWQEQEISNATKTYLDDLQQAFGHIQSLAGSSTSIELWVGETGWPTDGGSNYGAAIAGTTNAQTFWKDGVCATLDWNINVFYFEAFSEPWKPLSVGANGKKDDDTHWGAFTYAGTKPEKIIQDLSCDFP